MRVRAFKGKDHRQKVGDLSIMRTSAERVADSQRFCSGGNGVVESLQPGLTPRHQVSKVVSEQILLWRECGKQSQVKVEKRIQGKKRP